MSDSKCKKPKYFIISSFIWQYENSLHEIILIFSIIHLEVFHDDIFRLFLRRRPEIWSESAFFIMKNNASPFFLGAVRELRVDGTQKKLMDKKWGLLMMIFLFHFMPEFYVCFIHFLYHASASRCEKWFRREKNFNINIRGNPNVAHFAYLSQTTGMEGGVTLLRMKAESFLSGLVREWCAVDERRLKFFSIDSP